MWKYIIDEVIGHRRAGMLLPAIGVMLAVQMVGSVLGADRIVALEAGRIVEEGPDERLLEAGRLYAQMYQLQIGHLTGRD